MSACEVTYEGCPCRYDIDSHPAIHECQHRLAFMPHPNYDEEQA